MIATVVHVGRAGPAASWAATAIYPNGVKPGALELYAAAYAGNGLELTGVQVTDEFGTMSGPIVVVPESAVGLAYDGALSLAFERDADLAIGSGWPPLVVALEGLASTRLVARDLEPLYREPERRAPAGLDRGIRYQGGSLGYGRRVVGSHSCEAIVIATDADLVRNAAQRVCIVITDVPLGPGRLRDLASHANETSMRGLDDRALAVAISVGAPLRYDPAQGIRRALDAEPILSPRPAADPADPLSFPIPEHNTAFSVVRAATHDAVVAAIEVTSRMGGPS